MTKTCSKCDEEKPVSAFHKDKYTLSGFTEQCKSCRCKKRKDYYLKNSLSEREKFKKYYYENQELILQKAKQYLIENRELLNKRCSSYRRRHLKEDAFRAALRRAVKKQRTPKWADLKKIKDFYLNRPKNMQIDHILPLQGSIVSGLHVENNLQYLPPKVNLSKGNRVKNISLKGEWLG